MFNFIFIAFLFLASPQVFAHRSCQSDFRVSQVQLKHHLTAAQIERLRRLSYYGEVAEAWRELGSWGDSYAAKAHLIVMDVPPGQREPLFHRVVRNHWENVVGKAAYRSLFLPVARRHFTQYLQILQLGYYPDSDQIINSYLNAVRLYILPDITTIDSAWIDSGAENFRSWESLVGLDPRRLVPVSHICTNTSSARALLVVAHDLLDLMF